MLQNSPLGYWFVTLGNICNLINSATVERFSLLMDSRKGLYSYLSIDEAMGIIQAYAFERTNWQ